MLGLTIQLGHPPHQTCRAPAARRLVIVHTNGLHTVQVTFCRCDGCPEFRTQILRYGWWPATSTDPQTCATREALRLFHLLNLQGNLTPTDFYRSLEQLTDSRRIQKLPVSTHSPSATCHTNPCCAGSFIFIHEHRSAVAQHQVCKTKRERP